MVFRRVPLITCCEYNHKKRYVVKLNLEERDQLDGIINRRREADMMPCGGLMSGLLVIQVWVWLAMRNGDKPYQST